MEFTKLKSDGSTPSKTFDLRRELWLLTYASNSAKLVCELCDFLISGKCEEGDSIYTGIINSIFIVYARSFHWSRGVGKLTEKDIPANSINKHNEMMHLRDKLYAHKDLNGIQIESEIFNTVRAYIKGGKITMASNELIPRIKMIEDLKNHAELFIQHFDDKAKSLLENLKKEGCPPDGEYILNIDHKSDDIFKLLTR